jgi:hypothetical protein
MHNQIKKPDTQISFHPIYKDTDLEFSNDEVLLLNKGLKYCLDIKPKKKKKKNLIIDLDLRAEISITYLLVANQEHFRW